MERDSNSTWPRHYYRWVARTLDSAKEYAEAILRFSPAMLAFDVECSTNRTGFTADRYPEAMLNVGHTADLVTVAFSGVLPGVELLLVDPEMTPLRAPKSMSAETARTPHDTTVIMFCTANIIREQFAVNQTPEVAILPAALKTLFTTDAIVKIGCGVQNDRQWLARLFDWGTEDRIHTLIDVQTIERTFDPRRGRSLDELSQRYLGMPKPQSIHHGVDEIDWSASLSPFHLAYACTDALFTLCVYTHQVDGPWRLSPLNNDEDDRAAPMEVVDEAPPPFPDLFPAEEARTVADPELMRKAESPRFLKHLIQWLRQCTTVFDAKVGTKRKRLKNTLMNSYSRCRMLYPVKVRKRTASKLIDRLLEAAFLIVDGAGNLHIPEAVEYATLKYDIYDK